MPFSAEHLQIRRASVNNFGYGGTNAHVIIEKHETISQGADFISPARNLPFKFFVSARSKQSLQLNINSLEKWVRKRQENTYLNPLSYTLSARRSHFEWRTFFSSATHEGLLSAAVWRQAHSNIRRKQTSHQVAFLFSGQGGQWAGMGQELMSTEPVFRTSILESEKVLSQLGSPWRLTEEMFRSASNTRINESSISQPTTTALQIGLVDLLHSLGIKASFVIGHSSGEIAAAYASGILSQATSLRAAFYRGKIGGASGSMLSVDLNEKDLLKYVQSEAVSIACVNSPKSTTVSGYKHAIFSLKEELDRCGISNQILNVKNAYHSTLIQKAAAEYLDSLGPLEHSVPSPPDIFISSVTGSEKKSDFGERYWVQNLVSKVQYYQALRWCLSHDQRGGGPRTLIEIGPHSLLARPTTETLRSSDAFKECHYKSIMKRNATVDLHELVATLHVEGYDLTNVVNTPNQGTEKVQVIHDLDPYQWDHSKEYWYESRLSRDHRLREHPWNPLCGIRVVDGSPSVPTWRHIVSLKKFPWLAEHAVDDLVIFPGAAYLCMVLEVVRQITKTQAFESPSYVLREVLFLRALVLPPPPKKVELYLSFQFLTAENPRRCYRFNIVAISDDGIWHEHCSGRVETGENLLEPEDRSWFTRQFGLKFNQDEVFDRTSPIDAGQFYARLKANGNYYGPNFSRIRKLAWSRSTHVVAELEVPEVSASPCLIHPTTLDAIFQSSLPTHQTQESGSVMPTQIDEIVIDTGIENRPLQRFLATSQTETDLDGHTRAAILAFSKSTKDLSGPSIWIKGLKLQGLHSKANAGVEEKLVCHKMVWAPDVDFLEPVNLISQVSPEDSLLYAKEMEILNRAAESFIANCLAQLDEHFAPNTKRPHLAKLLSWMKRSDTHEIHHECQKNSAAGSPFEELRSLKSVQGDMLACIGLHLQAIILNQIDALQLMLRDDLLYRYYADDASSLCYQPMFKYIESLYFKNPRMKVLEIGAGTAAASLEALRALSTQGKTRVDRYDFTDVSPGFFDRARNTLKDFSSFVTFSVLNIEVDAESQGFERYSYDFIIAANVLHATESIGRSLQNVRKLLKPGGRLLLVEVTSPQPFLNLIFGALPDWWKGMVSATLAQPSFL